MNKGLILNIYRSDYDSSVNVFHGKKEITLVRLVYEDGSNRPLDRESQIFEPTEDRPPCELVMRYLDGPSFYIRPICDTKNMEMNGGTYASTSDSRFRKIIRIYGAVPIHDRIEC